jgi:hypothetical protein
VSIVREAVESSNVAAIGYDEKLGVLEVVFKPGRKGLSPVYRYAPVLLDEYQAMKVPGASVGRCIHALKTNPRVTATRMADAQLDG